MTTTEEMRPNPMVLTPFLRRRVATGTKKPAYEGSIGVRFQNHSLLPMLSCPLQYVLNCFVLWCLSETCSETETLEQSLCAA